MKYKTLLLNLCGICLNFYVLPLMFIGKSNETLYMLVVMPLVTIGLGICYTYFEQPHWFYPIGVCLLFIPTMFIYYNLSAVVFASIHFLGFIVGCLGGIIIKNIFFSRKLSRT